MENNENQFTLLSSNQNNFNNISTPNKEFTIGTPQIKNELFKLIPISPFINKNNSPQEKGYSYNLKNNSPFIINSSFGPFSPINNINNSTNNNNNFLETSSNFNKLDSSLNYKIIQKNLMEDFSPYKPKILFNNNSYKKETFERDTYSKGKEMYPFLHCTNLSKKFNALAEQIIKEKNLDFSFNEKEKEKNENLEINNNSFIIENNNNNNIKNEKFFYYNNNKNNNNNNKNGIILEEINFDIENIKNIFHLNKNKKKLISHTLQTLNYNFIEKFSLDSNKNNNNNNIKKNKFLTTSKKKSSQKKKNYFHSTNTKTSISNNAMQ